MSSPAENGQILVDISNHGRPDSNKDALTIKDSGKFGDDRDELFGIVLPRIHA